MSKYSMGIDFGTLSARAIIVDIETGEEKATAVSKYEHGIMAKDLMGLPLPADYALQHPKDYIDSLIFVVTECLAKADIDSADIIGIGVDFTSTTLLPVTKDGTPLCFSEKYKNEPHAYVKLWKHHAAQKEADEIIKAAESEAKKEADNRLEAARKNADAIAKGIEKEAELNATQLQRSAQSKLQSAIDAVKDRLTE